MNKRELSKLYKKTYKEMTKNEITEKEALNEINEFLEVLEKAILSAEILKLYKKGTFKILHRKSRKISNPVTREIMEIYPKKDISFKISNNLNSYYN